MRSIVEFEQHVANRLAQFGCVHGREHRSSGGVRNRDLDPRKQNR
jgi:hypothetical protein